MSRRSHLHIPHQLQQDRAQQIYENRIADAVAGNSESDWAQAGTELADQPWIIRRWQFKQAILEFFRRLTRSFKALISLV